MLLVEDMAVCEAAEQTTFQPQDLSLDSENAGKYHCLHLCHLCPCFTAFLSDVYLNYINLYSILRKT